MSVFCLHTVVFNSTALKFSPFIIPLTVFPALKSESLFDLIFACYKFNRMVKVAVFEPADLNEMFSSIPRKADKTSHFPPFFKPPIVSILNPTLISSRIPHPTIQSYETSMKCCLYKYMLILVANDRQTSGN